MINYWVVNYKGQKLAIKIAKCQDKDLNHQYIEKIINQCFCLQKYVILEACLQATINNYDSAILKAQEYLKVEHNLVQLKEDEIQEFILKLILYELIQFNIPHQINFSQMPKLSFIESIASITNLEKFHVLNNILLNILKQDESETLLDYLSQSIPTESKFPGLNYFNILLNTAVIKKNLLVIKKLLIVANTRQSLYHYLSKPIENSNNTLNGTNWFYFFVLSAFKCKGYIEITNMILDETANNPQLEDILLTPIDKHHYRYGNQNIFESMFQISGTKLMKVLVNWIIKYDKFQILVMNSDRENGNINLFTQLLIDMENKKNQIEASDKAVLINLIFELLEYGIIKGKDKLYFAQSSTTFNIFFGDHAKYIKDFMIKESLCQHPSNIAESDCPLSLEPLNKVWSILFESEDSNGEKYYHKYKIAILLEYIHRKKSSSTLLCPLSRKPVVSLQLIPPEGF